MKRLLTLFLLCTATLCASTVRPDVNLWLRCIAMKESNQDYASIGLAGERSMYHIDRVVWVRYSHYPFAYASTREGRSEAKRVAICHFLHLCMVLREEGWELSAFNTALLWNGGETRWHHDRLLRRHYDYALEIDNLYEDGKR